MMRIMLVDVNPEIVNYYKSFLKANFSRARVVATLSETSIDKFNQLIMTKNPQLIIMDIRFFAFSALRALRDMHNAFPNIKLLLCGEHSETEYMKKAMEFGVMDYFYKPVNPKELTQCLSLAQSFFEGQKHLKQYEDKLVTEYEQNIQLFRDRFLYNLTSGIITKQWEIEDSLQYFDIDLRPPFTSFVLRIDNFKRLIDNLNEREKHLLIYRIYRYAKDFLSNELLGICFMNSFNSISGIICGKESLTELLDICESLIDNIKNKMEISVTIGLGRSYNDLLDLHISAKESETALRYRYLVGYNTVIPIDYVEPDNHTTYAYPARKERLLVSAAITGEYDYAKALLEQVLSGLKEPLPDRLLPKIIMNIIISISRYASELGLDIETRFREFFNFADVLKLSHKQEAMEYMDKGLRGFCGFVFKMRANMGSQIFKETKEYIDSRYYENLSTGTLARIKRVTPEFLHKLFIEKMNMGIKEYLNKTRITQAKLLLDNNEPEEKAGIQVGFKDLRHFRSVYRYYEGMYPSEYVKFKRN